MKLSSKIPSVYSYSPASAPIDQQWGGSISDDAVTMVNTKMELDVQDNKVDELELILQVLEGTCNLDFDNVKKSRGYPEYTWKDPEEIVTDYLKKVFEYLNDAFEFIGSHLRSKIPVDIVITVPVVRVLPHSKFLALNGLRNGRIEQRILPSEPSKRQGSTN